MNLKIKEYKNYFSNFGIEYTTNSIFNYHIRQVIMQDWERERLHMI